MNIYKEIKLIIKRLDYLYNTIRKLKKQEGELEELKSIYTSDGSISNLTRTVSGQNLDFFLSNSFKTEVPNNKIELNSSVLLKSEETDYFAQLFLNSVNTDLFISNGTLYSGIKLSKLKEITIYDTLFSKGIVYAEDYSANFDSRSLVDKGYVDNSINNIDTVNIYNSDGTIPSGELRTITSEGGEGINIQFGVNFPPSQIKFRKDSGNVTVEFEQNFNVEGTLQSKNDEFWIKARESLHFNSLYYDYKGNSLSINMNNNISISGREMDFTPIENIKYYMSDDKKVIFKNNNDYGIRLITNNTNNNKFNYKDETGNYRSLQFGFVLGDINKDYDDITLIGIGFNDKTIITTNIGNLQIGCFDKNIIFNSSLSNETIFKDDSNKHGLLYSGFGENDATNSNNTADYSTLVNSSLVPKAYVDNEIAHISENTIYKENGNVSSLRTVTGEKIIFNNKGIDIKNSEIEILRIISEDTPTGYLYFTFDYYGSDYSLIYKDGETDENLIIGYLKSSDTNRKILLGEHIKIEDNGAFVINENISDDSYALKVNGFNNTSIVQFKYDSSILFDLNNSETDIRNRVRTQGAIRRKIEKVTSDKLLYGLNEHIIVCDTSLQTINVLLKTLSEKDGTTFVIKDSGNAGTNNITISTESGKSIDGSNSLTISNDYEVVKLIYSSSENKWFKII